MRHGMVSSMSRSISRFLTVLWVLHPRGVALDPIGAKPPPFVVPVTRRCTMNRHRLTIRENVRTNPCSSCKRCADPGNPLAAACHRIDDEVFDSELHVDGSSHSVSSARSPRVVSSRSLPKPPPSVIATRGCAINRRRA